MPSSFDFLNLQLTSLVVTKRIKICTITNENFIFLINSFLKEEKKCLWKKERLFVFFKFSRFFFWHDESSKIYSDPRKLANYVLYDFYVHRPKDGVLILTIKRYFISNFVLALLLNEFIGFLWIKYYIWIWLWITFSPK